MQSSFLYHAFGLRDTDCTGIQYKDKSIILNVRHRCSKKVCPECGSSHVVKNGFRYRRLLGLPVGGKKVIINVKVQRYKCREKGCTYDSYERIPFVTGGRSYTHRFARYVVRLLKMCTVKDVASLLSVSWDTVKEIHRSYLKRHYSRPSLKGVENIGIDEFASRKGHVYKTIVVDLDSGAIVYVGDGKGSDALDGFWERVRRENVKIKNIATDLSSAFISSVVRNAPESVHVFDHFHVVKLMNDALDDLRRMLYAMEKDTNKRKVIKGARYLLLRNGKDIFDGEYKTRLENALSMNEPLSKGYYLKESLHEIWSQGTKQQAEAVLNDWVEQARNSKISQLKKMANTVSGHRTAILAWYDNRMSTGKVEGINNKIKVMKRTAYGFRDEEYFRLRLYALHDCRITQNVG